MHTTYFSFEKKKTCSYCEEPEYKQGLLDHFRIADDENNIKDDTGNKL